MTEEVETPDTDVSIMFESTGEATLQQVPLNFNSFTLLFDMPREGNAELVLAGLPDISGGDYVGLVEELLGWIEESLLDSQIVEAIQSRSEKGADHE